MIFLELVPKQMPDLISDCQWALSNFTAIDGINIPDILRVPNRSYTAVIELEKTNINSLPHIRICDFSTDDLLALCERLTQKNIKHLLLISGDPPPNPLQPVFKHDMIETIQQISQSFPSLAIYAGYDPYRQSFKEEMDYAYKKIDAGAKGLFTQPIFNPHMAQLLIEHCLPCEWFIGISPVLTERSHNYWTSRNNVVFPPHFNLSLDYNIKLAKDIIAICSTNNQHNYIMPITTNIKTYLPPILND